MAPKLIACRVMIDEIRKFLPGSVETEVFEISQHVRPNKLKASLQNAISRADGIYDPIILGYGLCSNAAVGLSAKHSRIVIPKQHDCIGVFLGSHAAYLEQKAKSPGTFFLTHGYIQGYTEEKSGPFEEHDRIAAKFGPEKANWIIGRMMESYNRLVYIRTSSEDGVAQDRKYSSQMAERFGMQYEEVESSSRLLRKLIAEEWDEEFVVIEPGRETMLEDFLS